jgi:hypothetical protein
MLNLVVVAYMVWLLSESKRRKDQVPPPADN